MGFIELIESGDEIGVKIRNSLIWYDRDDITVSSNEDATINLYNLEELILTANTEDFITPKESSVKDLVIMIKNIITTVPSLQLTLDELAAIQNANSPTGLNPFATIADVSVSTNLSIGTKTGTTVDINSDTGTNATIPEATVTDAGLLSSAKRTEIIDNNAKVTNSTHTGEITGSGVLTADPTLITNKPSTTVASADKVLISDTDDSGNLKEVTAQSIADLTDTTPTGAFIYDSAGVQSGNTYTDFADMHTAMVLVNATDLYLKSDLTLPTGTFNQIQSIKGIGGAYAFTVVASSFIPNFSYGESLTIISSETIRTLTSDFEAVRLVDCVLFSLIAGEPMFIWDGAGTNMNLILEGTSTFSGITNPVFQIDAVGGDVKIDLSDGCTISENSITNNQNTFNVNVRIKDLNSTVGTIDGTPTGIIAVIIENYNTTLANKATPIGADSIAVVDSADKDRTKYVLLSSLSQLLSGATLRNISSTDTFATANETINCTSGTFTVNLPTAVGIQGTTYTLVNSGTGIITLDANGAETINGSLTINLTTQISRTVQSDGSNWIII